MSDTVTWREKVEVGQVNSHLDSAKIQVPDEARRRRRVMETLLPRSKTPRLPPMIA